MYQSSIIIILSENFILVIIETLMLILIIQLWQMESNIVSLIVIPIICLDL